MKTRMTLIILGMVLLIAGIAGAQVLLPGALIPKFVDPLPEGTTPTVPGITVVDATSAGPLYDPAYVPPLPLSGLGGSPYTIHLREFQAQILPSTGVPLAVPPIPANTPSWVWGYLTDADAAAWDANPVPANARPSYLGPVVVAERGVPAYPTYSNELPYPLGQVQARLPIDMTLDWANPLGIDCGVDPVTGAYTNPACGGLPYIGPLPDSVHIHGGEVAPASDGGPDSWFTQGNGVIGIGFSGNTLTYPNGQQEGTIWFHPHGFGITRLNVYAGMAGVYPIIDPLNPPQVQMPLFPTYDIPLIIQDRSFDSTGQIFYNLASNPQPNPTVHPFWIPEFIGDTIVVNGKTWPKMNVEPRQYRFRLLNGSNARFYDLTLNTTNVLNKKTKTTNTTLPFTAIATDDGYLTNAVSTPNIIIAPGERYEVIVDFTAAAGATIIMMNSARTPYPGGAKPTPNGTDTVMQFIVGTTITGPPDVPTIANGAPIMSAGTPILPILNGFAPPAIPPALPSGNIVRQLTLNEVIGPGGPLELVVNNSKYNLDRPPDAAIANPDNDPATIVRETELPALGDTEVWEIINITADAHPMHTHLTSFQILDRTPFKASQWINQYDALLLANGVLPGGGPPNQYNVRNADGAIGGNPPINAFLDLKKRRLPLLYEMGWKDTVITYPGEVTRIVVRWATTDTPVGTPGVQGVDNYPFDPTALVNGVGYVWHCHILDHEDNEMMRTYTVMPARQPIM